MKLRFATPDVPGRFLPPSQDRSAVREALSAGFREMLPTSPFHQALIGETLSVIYSPFYEDGQLFDAIVNRPVAEGAQLPADDALPPPEPAHWPVTFVPTLCPACGWDLAGERYALTLTCGNCRAIWKSAPEGLSALDHGCIPGDAATVAYVPFWRIAADVSGVALNSYADLVRAAHLPKIVREQWEDQNFYFWCPAFKIHPQKFLRLAQNLALCQPAAEIEPHLPEGVAAYPVTLPESEALEALHTILAAVLKPPQAIYPRLEDIAIRHRGTRLIFIPFGRQGRELVQPDFRLTISQNSFQFGRNL
jgi:hypothetical protein